MKPVPFILLCLMLLGCKQHRPAGVREFPDGFRGWAVIVWGVPGYPPIPLDHDKLIERFSADGIIITSTKQQMGWAHDEYYFLDAAGNRLASHPRIASEGTGGMEQGSQSMDYYLVFVGTEAELDAAPRDPPQVEKLFNHLYPAPNTSSGR